MPISAGLAAREHCTFDIKAYTTLERRTFGAKTAFDLDAIEIALDDLTGNPHRLAAGSRLAANLRRTGWKKLQHRRRAERPLLFDESVPAASAPILPHEREHLARAVETICSAVEALQSTMQMALLLSAAGVSAVEAGKRLGVSERYFRTLAVTKLERKQRR